MSVKNFIPQIWSARLLEHLDKAHVFAGMVNRDYEGEIKNFGDTVKVNQIGNITIKDYITGTNIEAPEDITGAQQLLVIDQAKYFNFAVDDVDAAQANVKLVEEAMKRSAYGLSDVSDKFIANLLANGAGTVLGSDAPIVPTVADAYDCLVDLATALTEKNVPMFDRQVAIPAWFYGLLLKDDRFVGNGTEYNKAILEGGVVGNAAGFKVAVSNNCPVNDGTYSIVACTTAAGSFAEQIIETEAYRPESRFADAVKGLHVYGGKVLQADACAVLKVAKA